MNNLKYLFTFTAISGSKNNVSNCLRPHAGAHDEVFLIVQVGE